MKKKILSSLYLHLPKLVLAPDVGGAVLGVGDLDGDDGLGLGGVVVVVGVAHGDQIWRGSGEKRT